MKRAKGFVTFLTATSLLFSSSVVCFAADTNLADSKTPVLINVQPEDKLIYIVKTYIASNNRVVGYYPVFSYANDLSSKILVDVEKAVAELNLSSSDVYDEDVIKFSVDESLNGYAKIIVTVQKDDLVNSFDYYLDKKTNIQISKTEFEKASESKDDSSTTGSALEVTMIPLRVNAEKLGWKVEWEQKTNFEPSKAILSKSSAMIKVLVDTNLNYDLIVNTDTTKNFITAEKLDKPAELQDSTLYVPSTFLEKFLTEKVSVDTEE